MALSSHWILQRGRGPIVAAAIHNGHDVREIVAERFALSEEAQLREEDPCTAEWAQIAKTQIIGLRSRFEVDLNRPREHAVYLQPVDAWGLEVWNQPPDAELVEASLREYDAFYAAVEQLLRGLVHDFGHVVVYDLHSYNHRREGWCGPASKAESNPEINIGTGTMDRTYWGPVVDRLIAELRHYDFQGRYLDVRENVRFRGGYLGTWIHETFPKQVCAIAIEVKKFYMNEWTGFADPVIVEEIFHALSSTLPGVESELKQL